MLPEAPVGGDGLDHRSIRRKAAIENRRAAALHQRSSRARITSGFTTRAPSRFSPSVLPFTVTAIEMQQIPDLRHQRAQPAGVVEIFHEELAGGPDVGQHGNVPRDLIEEGQRQIEAAAPRQRDQMNDGVGRAADGHVDGDGVSEGRRREDIGGLQILPDHLDDAPAAIHGHADVIGIRRGNRRRAGQRHAQGFGQRGHGGGGAHGHAEAGRARDAAFDVVPLLVADVAGAALGPEFPNDRCRCRAACRSSCRAASGRRAGRSPADSC